MKKKATWLIIATVMIIAGLGIIAFSFAAGGQSFEKHNFSPNLTAEHPITEDFDSINVDIDTADISFFPSEDGRCRMMAYNDEDSPHRASVKDDTLWIKVEDNRKWYEHIGIISSTPELEIYLPKDKYEFLYLRGDTGSVNLPTDIEFGHVDISVSTGDIGFFTSTCGDVSLSASTGHINVSNISANNLSLTTSTGKINLKNVNCINEMAVHVSTGDCQLDRINCGSFTSTGSTGHLTMEELVAMELISVERTTGDVDFVRCDAPEVKLLTDTGDITGSFLTEKIFFAESDTGDIDTPRTTSGGICEVTTDTGDIKLFIEE